MPAFAGTDLFDPVTVGRARWRNRIAMTAMTRARAEPGDIPGDMVVDYYRQRASAGLIISEGIAISPMASGYVRTPGLYTDAQMAAWRRVTQAVHDAGGHIYAQLWHVGRISHPDMLPNGADPVAPSAVVADSHVYAGDGFLATTLPRAMTLDDIRSTIEDYARAAEAAIDAGFDGVQIHGGNGYLPDQFLRDRSNRRTDGYGGPIANRLRFLVEAAEAVAAKVGADRLSIRIAPVTTVNDIADSDPQALFTALCQALNPLGIAFLDVVEGVTTMDREVGFDPQILRRAFTGLYMGNNGYDRDLAIEARRQGKVDLVGFGRAFISNPDLVERLREGWPIAPDDRSTYYGGDQRGLTDYPFHAQAA